MSKSTTATFSDVVNKTLEIMAEQGQKTLCEAQTKRAAKKAFSDLGVPDASSLLGPVIRAAEDSWHQQNLAADLSASMPFTDAEAHLWLVHPDGDECPDGCSERADPVRLAAWEAVFDG